MPAVRRHARTCSAVDGTTEREQRSRTQPGSTQPHRFLPSPADVEGVVPGEWLERKFTAPPPAAPNRGVGTTGQPTVLRPAVQDTCGRRSRPAIRTALGRRTLPARGPVLPRTGGESACRRQTVVPIQAEVRDDPRCDRASPVLEVWAIPRRQRPLLRHTICDMRPVRSSGLSRARMPRGSHDVPDVQHARRSGSPVSAEVHDVPDVQHARRSGSPVSAEVHDVPDVQHARRSGSPVSAEVHDVPDVQHARRARSPVPWLVSRLHRLQVAGVLPGDGGSTATVLFPGGAPANPFVGPGPGPSPHRKVRGLAVRPVRVVCCSQDGVHELFDGFSGVVTSRGW